MLSYYIIPCFIILIFVFAVKSKTNTFDAFIDGSREGLKTTVQIIPYILSMYIGVQVFYASGFMQDLIRFKDIPFDLILQGIFRPISSNASLTFMMQIYESYGVDSKVGLASSIVQGGTDTTIYVLTLYFGSIGITRTRYAYGVGLLSDLFCFGLCMLAMLLFL